MRSNKCGSEDAYEYGRDCRCGDDAWREPQRPPVAKLLVCCWEFRFTSAKSKQNSPHPYFLILPFPHLAHHKWCWLDSEEPVASHLWIFGHRLSVHLPRAFPARLTSSSVLCCKCTRSVQLGLWFKGTSPSWKGYTGWKWDVLIRVLGKTRELLMWSLNPKPRPNPDALLRPSSLKWGGASEVREQLCSLFVILLKCVLPLLLFSHYRREWEASVSCRAFKKNCWFDWRCGLQKLQIRFQTNIFAPSIMRALFKKLLCASAFFLILVMFFSPLFN